MVPWFQVLCMISAPCEVRESAGRRGALLASLHDETCHKLFWTRTSLYEWKSQEVEKKPRIQKKKVDSQFHFQEERSIKNPKVEKLKTIGYFPDI